MWWLMVMMIMMTDDETQKKVELSLLLLLFGSHSILVSVFRSFRKFLLSACSWEMLRTPNLLPTVKPMAHLAI